MICPFSYVYTTRTIHARANGSKTGLFSAVVTTLVVQSSQALQPDATEKNMAILSHILLSTQPYGSAMHTAPFSIVTDTLRPSSMDYWGNRFWFISLALSLFAAFMAVLIRQWVHVSLLVNTASGGQH